jgi:hypothetical protein
MLLRAFLHENVIKIITKPLSLFFRFDFLPRHNLFIHYFESQFLAHFPSHCEGADFLFPRVLSNLFENPWRCSFLALESFHWIESWLTRSFHFYSDWREQKQLFDMLWILTGVMAGYVASKAMRYQVKLRQLLPIIMISPHRFSPKLKVVQEIVNALLRCYRLIRIIIWPGAASHPNHIHQYHTEVFRQLLDSLEI